MGAPADVTVTTAKMNRMLQYEPRDLTLSVEAGMPFVELEANPRPVRPDVAAGSGWTESTVGGVVAANLSGPSPPPLRHRARHDDRDDIRHVEGKLVEKRRGWW